MSKKVFVKSFGCQMNEYDSEKIKDILESKQNLSQTSSPENADLIVLPPRHRAGLPSRAVALCRRTEPPS